MLKATANSPKSCDPCPTQWIRIAGKGSELVRKRRLIVIFFALVNQDVLFTNVLAAVCLILATRLHCCLQCL